MIIFPLSCCFAKAEDLGHLRKVSRFSKGPIHQNYCSSSKELKTFGSSGLNVIR